MTVEAIDALVLAEVDLKIARTSLLLVIAYFTRNQKRTLLTESSKMDQDRHIEIFHSRKRVIAITLVSPDTSKAYSKIA